MACSASRPRGPSRTPPRCDWSLQGVAQVVIGTKQVSRLRSFVSTSGMAACSSLPAGPADRATKTRSGAPGAKFSIQAFIHSWRSIGSSRGPLASAAFHCFSRPLKASRPSMISTVKPCSRRSFATASAMTDL